MDKKEFLINTPVKELITITDVLTVEYPNAKGYKIENNAITWWWEDNEDAQPSASLLTSLLNALKSDWDNYQYARNRRAEYPSITDQLDMIYHDIDDWKAKIKVIKDKHTKPA
tara:strand:+ start:80 stop:418 length:339 start_codon:yes stop_codon:yes gene_type:complete